MPKDWLRSQNQRILDSVRLMVGFGNQAEYSLGVAPYIQPALVVDDQTAPQFQYRGTTPAFVGAGGAGTRSEASIAVATGFFPSGGVLEVYVTIIAVAAGAFEIVLAPTLAAVTNIATRYNDLRLNSASSTGIHTVSTKNTAAASAGNIQGNNVTLGTNMSIPRIGPFFLSDVPGTRGLLVRPTADNVAVQVIFDWRVLFRAV